MVPFFKIILSLTGLLLTIACLALPSPLRSGFHLPDTVEELTLKYKTVGNLILLPVTINDTLKLNLILDTGTRNLVLFGRRFQKFFTFLPDSKVKFSGLGTGSPVFGMLSIQNKVEINSVMGLDIPVVVVTDKNLFGSMINVHGVIGYEIFNKFEIEINPAREVIIFRSPMHDHANPGYVRIPLEVKDCKPMLDCAIFITPEQNRLCDLMIDTGSTFGLLVKATDNQWFGNYGQPEVIGEGFNGDVEGYEIETKSVRLQNMSIDVANSRLIRSPWHNHASIGMDILRDYSIVFNYCKEYVEFRKIAQPTAKMNSKKREFQNIPSNTRITFSPVHDAPPR